MTTARLAPRTALFLPASNPRAIEKARGLDVDLVILDLEDAVRMEAKAHARAAAVEAAASGFGPRLVAIRINGIDSAEHGADLDAVSRSAADFVVLPKAETAADVDAVARACGKPLLAMIETLAWSSWLFAWPASAANSKISMYRLCIVDPGNGINNIAGNLLFRFQVIAKLLPAFIENSDLIGIVSKPCTCVIQ